MSIWGEIKKAVNSDLETPLNVLIENGVIGGYKLFTASGEFTVPVGVNKVLVTAIGSGGGGGGAGSVYTYNSAGQYIMRSATGGGGGSGYFIKDKPRIVTPGSKIPITINPGGASGVGATAMEYANGSAGGVGGSVSVGDLVTVNGGQGGGGATNASRWSSSDEDMNYGKSGAGGIGSVNGREGAYGNYKGYADTFENIEGGAGGVATEVFGGAYGIGGQGGDSTITEQSTTWYGGKSGDVGNTGAVLICWGQITHDTVY